MQRIERQASKRVFYLDVARAIAIISISLNHAVNRSYSNYNGQMAEFLALPLGSTLFKVVISVFSRIGVPLFLMITGVLILNKRFEDGGDVKRFYKHNLLSLFITAEIWYFLMYWFLVLIKPGNYVLETRGWGGAVLGMFETMLFQNQVTFGSMWYMPMILCVYLTIPFVAMAKNRFSRDDGWVWLPMGVLFCVSMVVPFISNLLGLLGKPGLTNALEGGHLFSFYYIYILIGYWIGKGGLEKLKTCTVVLVTVGTFLICCGYQHWAYSRPMDYLVSYDFPLLPVCAGFLFELLRRCADGMKKLEKPVTGLARISFGIYFVHIVIMSVLVVLLDRLMPGMYRPVRLIVLEVLSVGMSIGIIWPLSKIKVFKQYLFLIK